MCGRLALVVAATIEVVEFESGAEAFSRIGGKEGTYAVFPVLLIAAFVISDVGYRRFCIGEQQVADWREEVIVGLGKDELWGEGAFKVVRENAGISRRAQVASIVIVACCATSESFVLKQVGECVGFGFYDVAKARVDFPDVEPYWYVLCFDSVSVVVPVGITVIHCTVGAQNRVLRDRRCGENHEEDSEQEMLKDVVFIHKCRRGL